VESKWRPISTGATIVFRSAHAGAGQHGTMGSLAGRSPSCEKRPRSIRADAAHGAMRPPSRITLALEIQHALPTVTRVGNCLTLKQNDADL
jgi:hypothetical protein